MRRLRRWALGVAGWGLTLAGVVLFPLPGPGLLLMVAGLAILAEQSEWAATRVDRLRRRAWREAARGVRTPLRAWISIAVTAALAASGLVWVWAPAQPSWWDLPGWTWLPGGLWSGVSQIASGLLSLGLVLHARRRLGSASGAVAALADSRHAARRT